MAAQAKPNFSRVIVVILVLVALVLGFLLYQSGFIGGGNTCSSLRKGYERASAKEDYGKVSEYYSKMAELGCD